MAILGPPRHREPEPSRAPIWSGGGRWWLAR